MTISEIATSTTGYRLSYLNEQGEELGSVMLFLIPNRPTTHYGLLENLFVLESARGRGIGTILLKAVIAKAKSLGCYKLICTSRYDNKIAHELYLKHGFTDWGHEFRFTFST